MRGCNYKEIPNQPGEMIGQGEEINREFAIVHVILSVCIIRLVVVNELDDVEQFVLAKLGESIGHLLEVVASLSLLAVICLASLGKLGVIIAGNRASLAQDLQQGLRRVLDLDSLDDLVARLLEVQVVIDCGLGLLGGVHVDGHFEFTPTLILANVRGLGES
jgi:hypothetical protein